MEKKHDMMFLNKTPPHHRFASCNTEFLTCCLYYVHGGTNLCTELHNIKGSMHRSYDMSVCLISTRCGSYPAQVSDRPEGRMGVVFQSAGCC